MAQSPTVGKLADALAKAQGEMTHAHKEAENPAFKRGDNKASKYADLSNVVDAIRAAFSKHGLAYVQAIKPHDSAAVVETVLMHSSGEWIASEISIPIEKKSAHGFGSAFTYARRFSLAAIAGVAQADDDGNEASAVAELARVDESILANHLAALDAADSADALKSAFALAYKSCKHDEKALKVLIAAKEARKALVVRVAA